MATSHGAQNQSSACSSGEDPFFRRYIGQGEASLNIVVVGESGQGKSSLINGLLGEEIAKESDELESATESVDRYQYEQNGVHVVLFDTPGFGVGEDEEEAETLRKIREACPSIDILLYCIRMDTKRWPTRSDISTIRQYTDSYGSAIWQRAIFVMTFANTVPRHCPRDREVSQYFSEQSTRWENQVQQTLIRYAEIEYEEARRVSIVPVGDPRPDKSKKIHWSLPDRKDWFTSFWIHCTKRMKQRAVESLLQLNRHRCQAAASSASVDTSTEETSCDEATEHQIHLRLVPNIVDLQ